MITAERLHTVKEYYFSRKLREVRQRAAQGKPIINMGIGSPDLPPPLRAVEALQRALSDPSAHQYQSYQGLPQLREAIAQFYQQHFAVTVNPANEILPLMGSKEGIMHISMAFLNPGDQVLLPNPGYPTYTAVTRLVGAVPIPYELTAENGWFPDLEALAQQDLSRVKLLWVSYPHMPTGATATKAQLTALVEFATKHNILLVNDNPYSFVLSDNPTSILSIPGAKACALELNSISKTFNMAGWRVGMVLGNFEYINAILKVKSNMDSGMFYGIQKGAIAALQCGPEWFSTQNAVYARRKALIQQLADNLGCTYDANAVGLFAWCKLPQGASSAEEFIDQLLYDNDLFVAPGTIFGSQGEGYIRFSLCVTEEKIQEALSRF